MCQRQSKKCWSVNITDFITLILGLLLDLYTVSDLSREKNRFTVVISGLKPWYLEPLGHFILWQKGKCHQLHRGEDQGKDEGGFVPTLVPNVT